MSSTEESSRRVAGGSLQAPAPPRGASRPRGLVPPSVRPAGGALPPSGAYAVQLDVPRLSRRPWRAAKVALALLVVVSIALFAAVQAYDTFRDVVTTDDDVLSAYADGDGGSEFTSEAGGFTAEFPMDPADDTEAVPGSDGAQDAQSVSVEVDDVELAVSWFDLDEAPTDPAGVLSYVSGATESERGGVAEDRGMTPTAPVPLHDFVLRRDDGNDHIRHLLQGSRLYVVRVTGEGKLRPVFNRLADSLELEGTQ